MLYTPAALELALRWPFVSVLGGEDDRPETAESTLVKFAVSADMFDDSIEPNTRSDQSWICYGFRSLGIDGCYFTDDQVRRRTLKRMRANTVPGRSGGCALADAHCLVTILCNGATYLGKVPIYPTFG